MGLANKIAYKFATTMYTTFEQAEENLAKAKHVRRLQKSAVKLTMMTVKLKR